MDKPAVTSAGHDADPLTRVDAATLLRPLACVDRLLIAVSGGPDSMALMHFAALVAAAAAEAREPFPQLAIATVDHGLRRGSRVEAEGVAAAAGRLGLEARILTWEGPKPTTAVQERARHHRYQLLEAQARTIGATHIATAHTLDDQAETLLLRMARGSGPAGLKGMRRCVARGDILHVRPFLDVAKARLLTACRVAGWPFVEDPSNEDPRFARTRMRRLMSGLAAEGLDAGRLAVLARRLAEADEVIATAARRAREDARRGRPDDPHRYTAGRLMAEPVAVLFRVFEDLLSDLRPSARERHGAPRLQQIETLGTDLRAAWAGATPLRRTLNGSLVTFDGTDLITITSERPRRRPPI